MRLFLIFPLFLAACAVAASPHPPVPTSDASAAAPYYVQVKSLFTLNDATEMVNRLQRLGFQSYLEPQTFGDQTFYRVKVGPFSTNEAAESADLEIRNKYNAAYGIAAPASSRVESSENLSPHPSPSLRASVIPAGEWAIVIVSGWVMGRPESKNGRVEGFATLEECENIRRSAARSAVRGAVSDMSEGFGPGTDLGDIDYSSWQDLKNAGCAKSDGTRAFTVHQ